MSGGRTQTGSALPMSSSPRIMPLSLTLLVPSKDSSGNVALSHQTRSCQEQDHLFYFVSRAGAQ